MSYSASSVSCTNMTGVHIGQATKIDGDKVRSGVTVILPRAPADVQIPCYAGMHTLNGNGEVTGSYQIKDWGYINTVRLKHAILVFTSIIYSSIGYCRWMMPSHYHLSMFKCLICASCESYHYILSFMLSYTHSRLRKYAYNDNPNSRLQLPTPLLSA